MNSATDRALPAENYLLLLIENLGKNVSDGLERIEKQMDQRFNQIEERMEAKASAERMELEIQRLDRQDAANAAQIEAIREEEREKRVRGRWIFGTVLTVLTIVVNVVFNLI